MEVIILRIAIYITIIFFYGAGFWLFELDLDGDFLNMGRLILGFFSIIVGYELQSKLHKYNKLKEKEDKT